MPDSTPRADAAMIDLLTCDGSTLRSVVEGFPFNAGYPNHPPIAGSDPAYAYLRDRIVAQALASRGAAATITDAEVADLIRGKKPFSPRVQGSTTEELIDEYPLTTLVARAAFALGASRAGAEELNAAKREGWDEAIAWMAARPEERLPQFFAGLMRNERDRRHPEARRHVVTLSDGREVVRSYSRLSESEVLTVDHSVYALDQFPRILTHKNTAKDFADLQALAAAVQQEGA